MRPKIPLLLIRHTLPHNITLVVAHGKQHRVLALTFAIVASWLVLQLYLVLEVVVGDAFVDVRFVGFWLDRFLVLLDVRVDCFKQEAGYAEGVGLCALYLFGAGCARQ